MTPVTTDKTSDLRLALPKGRMADALGDLLGEAGVRMKLGARAYRPQVSLDGFETKILKPQSIVRMLELGSRDIGFTGADWVQEFDAELVELLDTGLDPVRLVAAAPPDLLTDGKLPTDQALVVASEMPRLTNAWIADRGLNATFLRSYGATEVYPPEDADCVVDITASGATLRANNLEIFDELLTSSTRLYANPRVLENPAQRDRIEDFVTLIKSVLDARERVMVELNVPGDRLDALVELLPCMRQPTIASLRGDSGFAVKVAVPRVSLPTLIPQIKQAGGADIVVSKPTQIVP